MAFFRAVLHACPADAQPGPRLRLGTRDFDTLRVPHGRGVPFPFAFEEAWDRLAKLPRLYLEPDGSFVWCGEPRGASAAWQLGGNLYDRDGRLQYVTLCGTCSAEALTRLCTSLGGDSLTLMVELVEAAVFLPASEFRRFVDE